jgi:PLP dependent protein
MNGIRENLSAVRVRIARACAAAGRPADAVALLAVSKTFDAAAVRAAAAAGQRAFGENYVQEALVKQAALADLALDWHFIGPIQSNKTRVLAEQFAWVHSVDRLKIAERLSQQRPPDMPALQVCVQVNISGERSKSGCAPDEVDTLCRAVARLPRLRLRGLMTIPAPASAGSDARGPYRALRERLAAMPDLALDTLSAGMSGDLEAAIAEGATIVRVGSAVFGRRDTAGISA